MNRLFDRYRSKVLPELKREFRWDNNLAVPRIEKVIVNAGIGKLLQQQPKNLEKFVEIISKITGQKPMVTRSAKAIAGFKVRQGQIVGLKVTLRGKRMYDFLGRLTDIALARSRDFRGLLRKGFDRHGNYSLGLQEYLVFPEVAEETLEGNFGLEVTIVTNAKTDQQAYQLLKRLGLPLQDD